MANGVTGLAEPGYLPIRRRTAFCDAALPPRRATALV
jgi:hypothetical protein